MKGRYVVIGILLIGVIAGSVAAWKRMRPVGPMGRLQGENLKTRGPASAPVQIVEFSDFQCPACRNTEPELLRILSQYPAQVQLVFRHFPLPGHRWAAISHQAAECANIQGKFWEYHDRLYQEQPHWSSVTTPPAEIFLVYARDLGIDLDRFGRCLTDEKVKRSIQEEKSRGESLKVTATPTFFIDGERLVGPAEFIAKGENTVRRALGLPEIKATPTPTPAPTPAADSAAASSPIATPANAGA